VATMHRPLTWYAAEALRPTRRGVHLVCVSESQRRSCPESCRVWAVVENGVPFDALQSPVRKRDYVMALGRICPEKGFQFALDAAVRADIDCVLAGPVEGYPEHLRYHREQILPRLDARRRWIGPVGFGRKRRLLTGARALLVPSMSPETSSLAAMEALACGTPVIAFPVGALPDIVEHGKTGFLAGSADVMAEAIGRVHELSSDDCRRAAAARFSERRMAARYLELYAGLCGPAEATA
jgi:glycosyltransferase involved in cell wall biosynthesis